MRGIALLLILFLNQLGIAQGKLAITLINPSDIHICQEGKYLDIEIRNTTLNTVSAVTAAVELPNGFYYDLGTVSGTGVTESNVTNLSKPVFAMGNIGVATARTFKIKVKTDCGLSSFLNGGGLAAYKVIVSYTGGNQSKISSPLTVLQPSLVFSSISNQLNTVDIGDVFIRELKVKNEGSGKLSKIEILRITKSGIKLTGTNKGVSSASFDTTITTLDSTFLKTIGNGNIYLERNEHFELIDTFKVLNCNNLSVNYKLNWYCGASICKQKTNSANSTISSKSPSIVLTNKSSVTSCLESSTSHEQRAVLYNVGNDTARLVKLNVFQTRSVGYSNAILSQIITSSFKYSTGLNKAKNTVSPYKTTATINSGQFSCLPSNAKGQAYVSLPNLAPGDSLVVWWKTNSCCPTTCGPSVYINRWKSEVFYSDQCLDEAKTSPVWGSYGFYQGTRISKLAPTDVLNNDTVSIDFDISMLRLISPKKTSKFEIELDLGNGLKHSLNKDDIKFSHHNGSTWVPDVITKTGNKVTAKFYGAPTVTLPRSELRVILIGDCSSLSSNIDVQYNIKMTYNPDTSCASSCGFDVYCSSNTLKLHCAAGCSVGLHFNGFSTKRISFGLPDNNNDGQPDSAGSLNMSKVKTRQIMMGDTLLSTFNGKVYSSSSISNWTYGKAHSKLNYGYYLDVVEAGLKIYRGGNLMINCNNVPISSSVSGLSKSFDFDIGVNSLMTAGCAVYSTFKYSNLDSLVLDVKYKVTKNPGNRIFELNFQNEFYLASASNVKYACDSFSSKINLVGSYFTNWGPNIIPNKGCNLASLSQNFYFGVGSCCSNYGGNDKFPYEYRGWAKLNEVILHLPTSFDYVKSDLIQYSTKGDGLVLTQRVNNLNSYKKVGNDVFIRTDSLYKDKGGILNISDDGFHGSFLPTLRANCNSNNGNNNVNYSFVFERLGHYGSGYDTVYTNTSFDVIEYEKPEIEIIAQQKHVSAYTDTAIWKIRLRNSSKISNANYVWLGGSSLGSSSIVEVIDLNTNQPLPSLNGIFKYGILNALNQADFLVKAVYTNCNEDSLELNAGFNCNQYPPSLSSLPCEPLSVNLKYTPSNTRLEAVFKDSSTLVPLCLDKEYTVELKNTGYAKIFNSHLDLVLNTGMELADTAWLLNYNQTDSVAVYNPQVVGNALRFELTKFDSTLKYDGLSGVDEEDSKVYFKFKLTTNCDFVSGSNFLIKPGGQIKCGKAVDAPYSISSPIEIEGIVKPFYSAVSFNYSPLDVCNYEDNTNVKFTNLGPDTTSGGEFIILTVPLGFEIDTSAITAIHNAPTVMSFSSTNGRNKYAVEIPANIVPGDSSLFGLKTTLNSNLLNCEVVQLQAQAVVKQPTLCVKDSSTCSIFVSTGDFFSLDSVIKREFSLDFLNAYSTVKNGMEDVTLNYSVSNTGSNKDFGDPIIVDFIVDSNSNGKFDSNEVSHFRDTINQAINKGITINREVNFSAGSGEVCNLLIYINPNNCACSESVVKVESIQLLNAGKDSTICSETMLTLGKPSVAGYTYLWNNESLVLNKDSAQTGFVSTNANSSNEDVEMVLTTSKGACESKDTIVITLYPGLSVEMADTMELCGGGNVIVGGIAQGGVGRVKNYLWTPADSLDRTNRALTLAYPSVDTKYFVNIWDDNNCSINDSTFVRVNQNPVASFTVNDTCEKSLVRFTNTTTTAALLDSFFWDLGSAEQNTTNALAIYDSSQSVNIKLFVQDVLGCKDSITQILEIYPNPRAAFRLSDGCIFDSLNFESLSTIKNGAFVNNWEINSDKIAGNNVNYSFPSSGKKLVKLITVSNRNCTDSIMDTVKVFHLPVGEIIAENHCFDDSISITSNIFNEDTIKSYAWNLSDGSKESESSFQYRFADTGTYTLSLLLQNQHRCYNTLNSSIRVNSKPLSSFRLQNICLGDTAYFQDSSLLAMGSISSYNWYVNGVLLSSDQSVSYYPKSSGNYQVKQVITSDSGCKDSAFQELNVFSIEDVNFNVLGNCQNDTIYFNAKPLNGDSLASINWIIESDTFTNDKVPYFFNSVGQYSATLTFQTINGCSSDSIYAFKIDPAPVAVINDTKPCEDVVVNFSCLDSSPQWNFGDGTTSNLYSLTHTYQDTGTYLTQLILTNTFSCTDTAEKEIVIDNKVLPDFEIQDVCISDNQWIKNTTTGNGVPLTSGLFEFNNGDKKISLDSFNYIFNNAGLQNVKLTIETNIGCIYTVNKTIEVFPLPISKFTFSPDVGAVINKPIHFLDGSNNALNVRFLFEDLSEYKQFEFDHTFDDSGYFKIKHWAISANNCLDSSEQEIYIYFATTLFLPNAFSPNSDNLNDDFKPVGLGLKSYKMKIHNRWGELVFDGKENEPWNGNETLQGVYLYTIRVIDYQNKVRNLKGTVHVLH